MKDDKSHRIGTFYYFRPLLLSVHFLKSFQVIFYFIVFFNLFLDCVACVLLKLIRDTKKSEAGH